MKSWPLFLLLAVLIGATSWVILDSDPAAPLDSASSSTTATTDSISNGIPVESTTTDPSNNISSAVDRKELESHFADASLTAGPAPLLPFEGPAATIKLRIVDGKGNAVDDGTAKFALQRWNEKVGDLDYKAWDKVNTLPVDLHGELAAAVPVGQSFKLKIGGAFWRTQTRAVQSLQVGEVVDLGEIALTPANLVAGVVINKEGEPLAKARVVISATNGSMWGSEFKESETTSEEGKFSFEGVRSGRFKFQVDAQGYVTAFLRAEHIQQRQGEFPLEIVLERGKSTRGRVVDEDGIPIAGAEIFTLQVDEEFNFWGGDWNPPIPTETPPAAVSDANGDFVVYGLNEDNVPKLGAKAEGYGSGYAEEVKVDGNSLIKLQRHFVVSGVVVAGDVGVERAKVSLQRYREDGEMERASGATTDETGKFSCKPVAPGSYTLSLTSALGTIEEQQLEITADVKDLRLELSLDNLLSINVTDADGQPVIGADVSLAPESQGDHGGTDFFEMDDAYISVSSSFGGRLNGNFGESSHATTTDINGVAKFASVPSSRYQLSVSCDGFATSTDSLEVTGTTQEQSVELSHGGHLRVRIVDAAAQPVVGIQVALRTADAAKDMITLSTDAAGRAIWSDLEAGEYQVSYSAADADGWWWNREEDPETPVDQSTVKVRAGKTTDFELAVSDLALVTVHVTRHGANAEDVKVSITEVVEDRNSWWGNDSNGAPTDGRGEVKLQPVTAGEYEISVKANKASPATKLKIHLHVGPQRIEMELDGGSVSGRLLESAGALENATVALASVAFGNEEGRSNMNFVSVSSNGNYTLSSSDEQSTNTRTDRHGNFEFTDIPDGQWRVIARAKGFGMWKSEPFTVQGGNSVELGSYNLYPGAIIQGHDANYVPPDNSDDNRRWRRGPQIRLLDGDQQIVAMAGADENGDFQMVDLPRGTYTIRKRSFTSEPIEVADGGTYRLDIPLEEPKEDK